MAKVQWAASSSQFCSPSASPPSAAAARPASAFNHDRVIHGVVGIRSRIRRSGVVGPDVSSRAIPVSRHSVRSGAPRGTRSRQEVGRRQAIACPLAPFLKCLSRDMW